MLGPQMTQMNADEKGEILICVNLRHLWAHPNAKPK